MNILAILAVLLLADDPATLLADLAKNEYPPLKENTPAGIQTWLQEMDVVAEKRGAIIWRLYQCDPKHARLAKLLYERWEEMLGRSYPPSIERIDRAEKDVDAFLKQTQLPANLQVAQYQKANCIVLRKSRLMRDRKLVASSNEAKQLVADALLACDRYQKDNPTDADGVYLLHQVTKLTQSEPHEVQVMERILAHYPKSRLGEKAKGRINALRALGKHITMKLTDVMSKKPIELSDYHGKIVLLDFWSTACGPCLSDIEQGLPALIKKYEGKLVVIGINVDDLGTDGTDYASEYLKKKNVAWPNHITYEGPEKGLPAEWGIMSWPTQFLIDQKGNLRFIDASRNRDEKIDQLLKEAK